MAKKKRKPIHPTLAVFAVLFAGSIILLLGNMQSGSIQLLLVGFGAALLLVSAVLFGMLIASEK